MFKYEMLVMGFLHDRPMHGYQIEREVKTHQMDSWAQILPSMVYKTLTNLKQDGMISKLKIEREGRLPERRVYQLTPEGKERMAKLVEKSLIENDLTKDLSNLAYFFVFCLPVERARECLNKRRAVLERAIKSLRKSREEFKGKTSMNRLFIIEKDLGRFMTELSYLRKLIKRLDHNTERGMALSKS